MAEEGSEDTDAIIADLEKERARKEAEIRADAAKLERERPAYMDAAETPESIRRAMQAGTDASSSDMVIKSSEMRPETRRALREQGLEDTQAILADDKGVNAEAAARTILKHEGLPDGSGARQSFKDVVPGQYDESDHGIDLVGITQDGRPYPIEVKKRGDPAQDDMGDGRVERLLPETAALRKEILNEREVNPALRMRHEDQAPGTPDPELSTRQMGGIWTRDRWLRLAKDPVHSQRLEDAGVDRQYLDLTNLENPESQQWKEILDNRTTVVVGAGKDDVTPRLSQQATLQRGFDVCVIDLEA